jgi:hypothetical protein
LFIRGSALLRLDEIVDNQNMQRRNSNGMSTIYIPYRAKILREVIVQDVRISGVSVTGDNRLPVKLTCTANEASPSVIVVANDITWR